MDDEIKEFLKFWEDKGVVLPNPENYPRTFKWYYTLWKFYKK